ncbi:uncharacterized protein LOC127963179 isoform X3 [Carassius gibelio]|uniref:uncharacterized protein LOC127963179 isoform X3 n=1 Tax=Carassius gibelio TaxID=101364 RepID=UPI002279B6D2|nr:uncharacterized protein LOC127963179 isoform X3 [Carassius gibelio]
MVFVKEENMSQPETCSIKHEEPETCRIKQEEPEPLRIKHEEPDTCRIKQEPETWRIEHEEQGASAPSFCSTTACDVTDVCCQTESDHGWERDIEAVLV